MSGTTPNLSDKRTRFAVDVLHMAERRLRLVVPTLFQEDDWANAVLESGQVRDLAKVGLLVHNGIDGVTSDTIINMAPPSEDGETSMRQLLRLTDKLGLLESACVGHIRPSTFYNDADAKEALNLAIKSSRALAMQVEPALLTSPSLSYEGVLSMVALQKRAGADRQVDHDHTPLPTPTTGLWQG